MADTSPHSTAVKTSRRAFLDRVCKGMALSVVPFLHYVTNPRLHAQSSIEARLTAMGVTLPPVPTPAANYVPYLIENGFAYIAGQLPFRDGEIVYPGKVPADVSIEQGQEAAKRCAINIIAALKGACEGDLNRVRRCMRLEGFVASNNGFNGQSAVVNGASDFMAEVFGEAGRHTRVAVGVNELPLNACIEVSAVFAID